jgi:putative IMPACT (imprinted ancient) family translation regulator
LKGLLLASSVVACGASVSAQTTEKMTKMSKDVKTKMVTKADHQDKQSTDALVKDKDLQNETADYLAKNTDTQKEKAMISKDAKGSQERNIDYCRNR